MKTIYWGNLKTCSAAIVVSLFMLSSACSWTSRQTLSDGQLRQAQVVYYGTIVNASEVEVADEPDYLAPILGGAAGGIIGMLLQDIILPGSGVTIIAGATAGALMGGANNTAVRKKIVTELTVTLENGSLFLIVIAENHEYFLKNDPVRIIFLGDGLVRLQHIS